MHNFILQLSEKIDKSVKYQKVKSFFRSLLEDVNYPYKRYFDAFMILLIVISISILIMSKTGKIPEWLVEFDLYFVTGIFALEYLLRLWISHDIHKYLVSSSNEKSSERYWTIIKSKLRYMISLPALIDLVAIFPKFRIIRLLKLYHYMHGASSLFNALLKKRFEFIFLGYMLFGITFTFGSIFYLLEFGINEELHSYLDAIYWALVTISTVGYGDISPVTEMGKIISMFGIVIGIAMISFVTSVMVSAFSERFDELRNQDSINHVNKMHNVVIINGYGHLGATIAKKLKIHKMYEPVIIESNEEKASIAVQDGYQVIHADGSSAKIINDLYQRSNIAAMLTLRSSDIDNIYFILNAKSIRKKSVVYTRMNQVALHAQYVATKVDGIVEPYDVVDTKTFNYLKKHSLEEHKSIVFFGYTHKSKHICKALQKEGLEVTIYEIDNARYESARADEFTNVVFIDKKATQAPEISDGIAVCAMDDEALNVYYAITLRAKGFDSEIVALSDSKEDNRKLLLAGVSRIFDMYDESASQFVEMIENKEKDI
ncbi:NAD-binding protein [Sulfurovum sp.]|uniref:NAD-binding protein n=1 Tax=Sulfurovum sp. TaxID=1969726 RepID=UPI0028680D84|nr:NAD-binding protein [Sulfurovum sp.]